MKVKKMPNKKGVMFLFLAIILTLIIILTFTLYTNYRLRNKMFVIETRISTMNDFIKNVEDDLSRGLYISSYRSILSLGESITQTGSYIGDVNASFKEALLNGTINQTVMSTMSNATFLDWSNSIAKVASQLGINFSINVNSVDMKQKDPWNVFISVDVTLNISDIKDTAKWSRTTSLTTEVSIEGFEDPLYLINSFGRVSNIIIKATDTNFNNVQTLKQHINNSYYIASLNGPDFIQRYEGNLSNSSYGIESIVDLNEFTAQEVPVKTKSHVDYIYFSSNNPSSCQVNETASDPNYSWFRLDDDHLATYSAECV